MLTRPISKQCLLRIILYYTKDQGDNFCFCPQNNQLPSCAKQLYNNVPYIVIHWSAGAFRRKVLFLSTKQSIAKLRQAAPIVVHRSAGAFRRKKCCFCPKTNQLPSCAEQLSSAGPPVLSVAQCCFCPQKNQLPSCAKLRVGTQLSSTDHRSAGAFRSTVLFLSAKQSIAKLRQAIVNDIHRSAGASRRKVLFLSAKQSIAKLRQAIVNCQLSSTSSVAQSCFCPQTNQLPSCAKQLSSTDHRGPPALSVRVRVAQCCFRPQTNQLPSCAKKLSESTGPSVLPVEKCCFCLQKYQFPCLAMLMMAITNRCRLRL